MDPCPILHCHPESAEEKGRSSNAEAPRDSSAGVHREITTILSSESAFLYGNVVVENPKNPSPSSPNVIGYDWASHDKIINCLEHDDFDSRVFDIMGRKGHVRDWFRIMSESKPGSVRDVQRAAKGVSGEKATNSPQIDRSSSPDVTVIEERDMWSSAFNLGHQIVFNMDESKKKRTDAELKKEHDQFADELEMLRKEAFDHKRVITSLREERDTLLLTTAADNGGDGKDVYQGHLVSLSEIPEGALLESKPAETEENVVAETPIIREIRKEDPVVPSTNVVDVVHVE
ncbi:hypothetical protein LR48_Vigan397s000400 [Vigna angularis]|uniref:Uncharacterized protein n=1 Tax=Phaseolus angularis TaxID=3914 RepID=A0A0L9T904_PHAAN|nr:hypothetical protein LR48_Vigan397s000400 [Vigna angularis]